MCRGLETRDGSTGGERAVGEEGSLGRKRGLGRKESRVANNVF